MIAWERRGGDSEKRGVAWQRNRSSRHGTHFSDGAKAGRRLGDPAELICEAHAIANPVTFLVPIYIAGMVRAALLQVALFARPGPFGGPYVLDTHRTPSRVGNPARALASGTR